MTDHNDPDPHAPPSDLRAEAAVLGACLIAPQALDTAAEHLTPDDFYRPAHGELFAAMVAMRDGGHPVDPLTLADRLGTRATAVGGAPYLHTLYAGVPTAANAGYYAEIVANTAVRRRLLAAGQRAVQLAHTPTDDPAAAVERARQALDTVATQARGDVHADPIDELAERAIARYANPAPTSLPTGWPDLDRLHAGGLRPGTLTVVGARPATGKTMIGTCLVAHAALHGAGALFVSLEMPESELTDRVIANLASVELTRLIEHRLDDHDWQAVQHTVDRLRGIPLRVTDHFSLGLTGIRSLARDQARRPAGLGLIVVDYLSLIRPADDRLPRQEQVAGISRGLKMLAKELNVPVVALHQLNRLSEQRASRRPVLSDLRESGAVEQDSDIVWLLHRDDTADEHRHDLEVIVAKNRQGPIGSVHLSWVPRYARVGSLTSLRQAG